MRHDRLIEVVRKAESGPGERCWEVEIVANAKPRRQPLAWAFLIGSALAVAGTLWSQLGVTSATTLSGGYTRGALYTGFVLAVLGLSAGLAIPLTPGIAGRFGAQKTFVVMYLLAAAVWAAVGVIVLLVDAPLIPLLIGMLFTGAFGGVAAVLTPSLTHAYLQSTSLARAYSIRSVASGIGAVIGALTGAAVISNTAPGWGLIGNAILSTPLGLLVLFRPPPAGSPPVKRVGGGLLTPWQDLARSRPLRRIAVLVAAVAICVLPVISMIVPITQALRQSPLIPGAGIVLAGAALGRLGTPAIVDRLQRGRDEFTSSLLAITATGILVVALAASSLVLTGRVELVVWAGIAMAASATRFASRSFTLGAANSVLGPGRGVAGTAAVIMVGALAFPIGTVAWGIGLSLVPPWAVLTLAAVGILSVATVLRLGIRKTTDPVG